MESSDVASSLRITVEGIVSSTISLYSTIDRLQASSKPVHDLKEELTALLHVLGSLTEVGISDADRSTLDLILLQCGNACKAYEQELQKCSDRPNGCSTRTARARNIGDDAFGIRSSLKRYTSTFKLALDDINLRKSAATAQDLDSHRTRIETTAKDFEIEIEDIVERLRAISATSAIAHEELTGDLPLMAEALMSAVKCSQLCANLSYRMKQAKPDLPVSSLLDDVLAIVSMPSHKSSEYDTQDHFEAQGLEESPKCHANRSSTFRELPKHSTQNAHLKHDNDISQQEAVNISKQILGQCDEVVDMRPRTKDRSGLQDCQDSLTLRVEKLERQFQLVTDQLEKLKGNVATRSESVDPLNRQGGCHASLSLDFNESNGAVLDKTVGNETRHSVIKRRDIDIRSIDASMQQVSQDSIATIPLESEQYCLPSEGEQYGASKLERDRQREEYIKSIKPPDVCKLASNHNKMKPCHEFRKPEHGSFNVCFFVRFPSDGKEWVVRFPICPLLNDAWHKLQSEITTMRYVKENTTIPIAQVHGYGRGDALDTNNPTKLPYIILEYIHGRPLDPNDLLRSSQDISRKFYSQLAHILSQLRMLEFDYSGSLMTNTDGLITLTSPHSVDLNSLQLHGRHQNSSCRPHSSAIDFAFCRYQILLDRLDQPISDFDEEDAQHEVFALEDFKGRLFNFIDPSLNHRPFVLTHGDLRPSNIIVDEDFTISAIIDWEWSCTVPRQFFVPPTWFAGKDIPSLSDKDFQSEYSKFHQQLTHEGLTSAACRRLAAEWSSNLSSRLELFLPIALLNHQNFTLTYYSALFLMFYKDTNRKDKLREFYERDGQTGIFSKAVRRKLKASKRYTKYLHDNGLGSHDDIS